MTSAERVERVLRIAEHRFLSVGYARCSVDSIARDARVSKRDIYDLWPNKAALFSAVVADIYSHIEDDWDVAIADMSTRDALVALGRRNIELFLEERQLGMMRASIESVRQIPDIAAQIHRGRVTSWAGFSNYFLKTLGQRGFLGNDLQTAAIRFGSLNVEGTRYLLGAPRLSAKERQTLAERTTDIFLSGAFAQPFVSDLTSLDVDAYQLPQVSSKAAIRLSAERFDALMDVALSAFCASGFAGIKIAEVAKTAGVSTATIYRHFPDKDALFQHAVKSHIYRHGRARLECSGNRSTPLAALTALARALLERHLAPEHLALVRLLAEEAVVFPALAHDFYEQEIRVTAEALRRFVSDWGLAMPDILAVRAFYTLATFGTRFLLLDELLTSDQREALSAQTAVIFLNGAEGAF